GVPFSDPLADGPTIQRSTQAALDQGMTVAGVFDVVREARLGIPVILMTYLNPVLAFGVERFVAAAQAAGASGLLLIALPAGPRPRPPRAWRTASSWAARWSRRSATAASSQPSGFSPSSPRRCAPERSSGCDGPAARRALQPGPGLRGTGPARGSPRGRPALAA